MIVVDDLDALARQTGRAAISLIKRLLSTGAESGVHVLGGWGAADWSEVLGQRVTDTCAMAYQRSTDGRQRGLGEIEIAAGGVMSLVRPAELSARDLDQLVRQVQGEPSPEDGEGRYR